MEGVTIPVLDGTNFQRWKLQMQSILEVKEIDEIVFGADTGLTATELQMKQEGNEAAIKKAQQFKKAEAKARMLFYNAVDARHLTLISSCATSREMWNRLNEEYSDKMPTNVEAIMEEYYSAKMDESKPASDFIAVIENLVARLKIAGHDMPEASITAKIVTGLGHQYCNFRRSWSMLPDSFKNKAHLIKTLKMEEKSLPVASEALVAKRIPGRGTRHGRKKLSKEELEAKKKSSICAWCKLKGHWWKDCPSRPEGQVPEGVQEKKGNRRHSHQPQQSSATGPTHNYEYAAISEIALSAVSSDQNNKYTWLSDSGASEHMTGIEEWIDDLRPLVDPIPIKVGSGEYLYATGVGSIGLTSVVDGKEVKLRLRNVHYVPKMSFNLFSVGSADKQGLQIMFSGGKCKVMTPTGITVAEGSNVASKLYRIKFKQPLQANIARVERTPEEWHAVLGHPDRRQVELMAKTGAVMGMKIVQHPRRPELGCGYSQAGKGHAASHPESGRARATAALERIHVDLVGKINPPSFGGSQYFMVFKDEYSSYMFVDFFSDKSQAGYSTKKLVERIETLKQTRVRILRTDNGTEFRNTGLKLYCESKGIIQEFSAPRTPQQNGEAERSNRTVIETARTILQASGLELGAWAEAVKTAVYLRNRTTNSRTNGKTPFELFHGHTPDIAHLIRFGLEVHVLDHDRKGKFSSKTLEAFMIGYDDRVNTYRCLVKGTKNVLITSDVVPAPHKVRPGETSNRQFATFLVEWERPERETTPPLNNNDDAPEMQPDPPVRNESLPRVDQVSAHVEAGARSSVDLPAQSSDAARDACTMPDPLAGQFYPTANVNETFVVPRSKDTDAERVSSTPKQVQITSPIELAPDYCYQSPVTDNDSSALSRWRHCRPESIANITGRSCDKTGTTARADLLTESTTQQPVVSERQSLEVMRPLPPLPEQTGSLTGNIISRLSPIIDQARELRSRRTAKPPERLNLAAIALSREPKTFADAITGPESAKWRSAIDDEFHAHHKNQTWRVVPKPSSCSEIDARWLFKVKDDGRYKARLVARGFSQVPGIDYSDVFSPVVRMESIRLLFATCAQERLIFVQFDVTTAFLYGHVDEELYLKPPPGLKVPDNHTCRLQRSLYGLKQSPRCWNRRFKQVLEELNMVQSSADPCVYIGRVPELVYVALYVDDGLVFAKTIETTQRIITHLNKELEVKVIKSRCFLGVEIEQDQDSGSIFIHQQSYISRVLERFRMTEAKTAATPVPTGHALNNKEVLETPVLTDIPYQEALGSLLYCASATRPDLSYALSVLSKYASCPRAAHWEGIKRLLRYLQGTQTQGLLFERVTSPRLVCYSDADYAGDHQNRRSISGMVAMINNGPISYRSRQQGVVALSVKNSTV